MAWGWRARSALGKALERRGAEGEKQSAVTRRRKAVYYSSDRNETEVVRCVWCRLVRGGGKRLFSQACVWSDYVLCTILPVEGFLRIYLCWVFADEAHAVCDKQMLRCREVCPPFLHRCQWVSSRAGSRRWAGG